MCRHSSRTVGPASLQWATIAARCDRSFLVRGLLDLGHDATARDHLGCVAAMYGCAEAFGSTSSTVSCASSSSRSERSDPVSEVSEEDMMSAAVPRDKTARLAAFRAARKHFERMDREERHDETRFVFQHKGLIFIADVSQEYIIDIQEANRRDVWQKTVPVEKRHRWIQKAKAREAKRAADRSSRNSG